MKKNIIIALATLAFGLGACDSDMNKAPGKYEKTTSATDANGTTVEHSTSTDVSVDSQGNKKAVTKSKTTRDPKGLLNKTTTESETIEQEKQ